LPDSALGSVEGPGQPGLAPDAWAHQPRYLYDNQLVLIQRPDVSQAFYGELKSEPANFVIDLKQAQDLYFQILVPDLPDIAKDKTVTIDYAPSLGQAAASFASRSRYSMATA